MSRLHCPYRNFVQQVFRFPHLFLAQWHPQPAHFFPGFAWQSRYQRTSGSFGFLLQSPFPLKLVHAQYPPMKVPDGQLFLPLIVQQNAE
jgi:hypothetical protein